MSRKSCMNCRFGTRDKERDIIDNCVVARDLENKYLINTGKNGNCPYHEYQEYCGMK